MIDEGTNLIEVAGKSTPYILVTRTFYDNTTFEKKETKQLSPACLKFATTGSFKTSFRIPFIN